MRIKIKYPTHIASPSNVAAHLRGDLMLVAICDEEDQHIEWDALSTVRADEMVVEEITYQGFKLETVLINTCNGVSKGTLINEKYFFSDSALKRLPSLDFVFGSLAASGLKPMVRRDSVGDYMCTDITQYTLIDPSEEIPDAVKAQYFEVSGCAEHGIDCLADLVGQCYKFTWCNATGSFVAINDAYEITKRLRKPWLSHLVEMLRGDLNSIVADNHKLIAFLLQKTESLLAPDEKSALSSYMQSPVTLQTLNSINERNAILSELNAAYQSSVLLTQENVNADPLLSFTRHLTVGDLRFVK